MKALWHPSYRTWWAVLVATTVANWGGGILGIVVTWTVLTESRSILAIALIAFLGFYPHVLFWHPGGGLGGPMAEKTCHGGYYHAARSVGDRHGSASLAIWDVTALAG